MDKTTTWGDCPNRECMEYGRMVYGIEPGDVCEPKRGGGCHTPLRWWDRWHDGEHRGESGIAACLAGRPHEGTGPAIENGEVVCSTCHKPVYALTSGDGDSATIAHW